MSIVTFFVSLYIALMEWVQDFRKRFTKNSSNGFSESTNDGSENESVDIRRIQQLEERVAFLEQQLLQQNPPIISEYDSMKTNSHGNLVPKPNNSLAKQLAAMLQQGNQQVLDTPPSGVPFSQSWSNPTGKVFDTGINLKTRNQDVLAREREIYQRHLDAIKEKNDSELRKQVEANRKICEDYKITARESYRQHIRWANTPD